MLPLVVCAAAIAFSGTLNSGLGKGENVTPFHPKHIVGPLAGSSNCFPCTFQNRPQVQAWINGDDAKNVAKIATPVAIVCIVIVLVMYLFAPLLPDIAQQNKGYIIRALVIVAMIGFIPELVKAVAAFGGSS